MEYTVLLAVLSLLAFLTYRGARIWSDARCRESDSLRCLGWALRGAIVPSTYWWDTRIDILPPEQRGSLLAIETLALGLSKADSEHCPLCKSEIPAAWALDVDGSATVGPGPVECPGCDFRLDACRHCVHFQMATSGWGQTSWLRDDLTSGRCRIYKASQPVEQVSSPELAKRLRARGYETVRAPMPIKDSYLPPDHCRAFEPEQRRLQASEIGWPDARRTALLRLLAGPVEAVEQHPSQPPPEPDASEEELWLL